MERIGSGSTMTENERDLPSFGDLGEIRTVVLPDEVSGRCAYCGGSMGFWQPTPNGYVSRAVPQGFRDKLPVSYRCFRCNQPVVLIWAVRPGDTGFAETVGTPEVHPPALAERLPLPEFDGTLVHRLRNDAWNCYYSRRYRAAVLIARSALQSCFRLYTSQRSSFRVEAEVIATLGGAGLDRVVADVRNFGNSLAHPGPYDLSIIAPDDVLGKLTRLDAVLRFTAELERVGVLHRVARPEVQ